MASLSNKLSSTAASVKVLNSLPSTVLRSLKLFGPGLYKQSNLKNATNLMQLILKLQTSKHIILACAVKPQKHAQTYLPFLDPQLFGVFAFSNNIELDPNLIDSHFIKIENNKKLTNNNMALCHKSMFAQTNHLSIIQKMPSTWYCALISMLLAVHVLLPLQLSAHFHHAHQEYKIDVTF